MPEVTSPERADGMSFTTETASLESPFLGLQEALDGTEALEATAEELGFSSPVETPFIGQERFGGADVPEVAGQFEELLAELYDSEFDRALFELSEAAAEAAESRPFVQGETNTAEAEHFIREWLEPLHRDSQAMLEAIGESLAGADAATLTDHELNELLAEHEPQMTGENPVFENFLGGLFNAVRKGLGHVVNAVKKGVKAVGRLIPIGPLLDKIKSLVRPLLERVLQMGLDKLPPELRGAAEMLKNRLLGTPQDATPAPAPAAAAPAATDAAATAKADEVQREFDSHVASLLFAEDEADHDMIVAAAHEAAAPGPESLRELNQARERFVAEIRALPPGGDAGPAMENFLPAVLPFLKLGISLIGRDRVIRFLARILAPLIRPFVGDQTSVLSQAIVSSGLGLISLEAPANEAELAGHVIANTVEDTFRHLVETGGEAFEDPHLLEAAAASAFNEAVAANFPPLMVKPEHREISLAIRVPGAEDAPRLGMWVPRWHHRHGHRRYTKSPRAWITPTVARNVVVFGGTPLSDFLRDHYGITTEVIAPVHLFQAIPGTSLMRIAHAEPAGIGLGRSDAYWKLQPLTPEAAGILLGEPGLGRSVDPRYLQRPGRICVGQRFFALELPESRTHVHRHRHHSSHVNVVFEFASEHIRVAVHLAEADAQRIAAPMRMGNLVVAMQILSPIVRRGVDIALSDNPLGHLRWIDGAARTEAAIVSVLGNAAQTIGVTPARVHQHLAHEIRHAVLVALKGYLHERGKEFIAAADRPAHGVTLVVRLRHPAGMALLRRLHRGEKAAELRSLGALFPNGFQHSSVELVRSHHHRHA